MFQTQPFVQHCMRFDCKNFSVTFNKRMKRPQMWIENVQKRWGKNTSATIYLVRDKNN